MIQRVLISGVEAAYVLMDTWFTQQPLIKAITEQGIEIGIVKATNQRYLVDHKWVDLKNLYKLATPTNHRKDILRSPYYNGKWCSSKDYLHLKQKQPQPLAGYINHGLFLEGTGNCPYLRQTLGHRSVLQGNKGAIKIAERSAR